MRGSTHHAGAVRAGNRRRLLAPAAPHDSGRDGHARRRGEVPRHQRLRGGLLRRQYRGRRSGGAGRVGAGPVVNGQEMSPLARTAMSRVRTAMSRTWPAGHSSWLVRFVRRPGTHRGPGRWRSRANREGMGSGGPPIGYQRAPSSRRRCLASEPCSDSRRHSRPDFWSSRRLSPLLSRDVSFTLTAGNRRVREPGGPGRQRAGRRTHHWPAAAPRPRRHRKRPEPHAPTRSAPRSA